MWQDFHYALRQIRKTPITSIVILLTLGVGIGANTAIFSVLNSVLLRPLDYADSQRLYIIREIVPQMAKSYPLLDASLADFLIWQKKLKSFNEIVVAETTSTVLTGSGEAAHLIGTRGSANLLALLGVRPALGRGFVPDEDLTGQGHVVILTDSFWRSRFQANPGVIGRTITLDGIPHTVVGVLPPSLHLPGGVGGFSPKTQYFVPLNGPKYYEENLIGEFDFTAIGRLKAGVSPETATAELNVVQAAIAKQAGGSVDLQAAIFPFQSVVVGPARRGLFLLMAAVGAVLLIVCLNIANLLLARAPDRVREAGIRNALGARRSQLMRPMLLESLLLALLGGSLGLLVAWAGVSWLAHVGSVDLPRLNDVRIDGRALLFVILASVATAALSGTVPAWLVSRASLSQTLAAAGKSLTESRTTRRTHAMLVAFQVSVCTLLLVIAGLLGRSLLHLLHLDPGFSVEHVLTADVDLPVAAYEKPATRDGFYSRVLEGIRRLPGVRSAAWISILPLEGEGSVSGINLPGEILPPDQEPIANYRPVSPDYFATLGIPLVSGRAFTERDRGTRGIVVSQALAHRLWPNQEPVGQHCIAKWGALQLEPSEVIGVAGDIHNRLGKPPLNVVYVSDAWSKAPPAAPDFASIVVRTDQDPATMASAVRTVIHREGPGVPILALRPMSEVVSLQLEGRRFQLSLTACFAISALLLVALGVFGVLAYSVERRQREFGIRTAFGAQHHDLLALVMWQGLWPVTFGLACGIVAAVLSGSVLRSFLAGVTPFDPLTLAGVALLIAVVAALACYLPARRAISADPVVSLRCE